MRRELTYNPETLARRIRALAEKRIDQAGTAPDIRSRKTLEDISAAYHALANVVARQAEIQRLPGLNTSASPSADNRN